MIRMERTMMIDAEREADEVKSSSRGRRIGSTHRSFPLTQESLHELSLTLSPFHSFVRLASFLCLTANLAFPPRLHQDPVMLPTSATSAASAVTKAGKPRDLQPVMTLGRSAAACASASKAYGACVLAQYEAVDKNMCEKEFREFKECVQQKVSVRRGGSGRESLRYSSQLTRETIRC